MCVFFFNHVQVVAIQVKLPKKRIHVLEKNIPTFYHIKINYVVNVAAKHTVDPLMDHRRPWGEQTQPPSSTQLRHHFGRGNANVGLLGCQYTLLCFPNIPLKKPYKILRYPPCLDPTPLGSTK